MDTNRRPKKTATNNSPKKSQNKIERLQKANFRLMFEIVNSKFGAFKLNGIFSKNIRINQWVPFNVYGISNVKFQVQGGTISIFQDIMERTSICKENYFGSFLKIPFKL